MSRKKMNAEDMVVVSFRLPKTLNDRLNKISYETHITKTYFITECILEQMEDLEDYQDAIVAINNRDGFMSLSEVKAALDV